MAPNSGAQDLVQVILPTGQLHASFLHSSASLADLILAILREDGDSIVKEVCGKVLDGQEKVSQRWGIQRCLKSKPNRDWTDAELEALQGDGALPSLGKGMELMGAGNRSNLTRYDCGASSQRSRLASSTCTTSSFEPTV